MIPGTNGNRGRSRKRQQARRSAAVLVSACREMRRFYWSRRIAWSRPRPDDCPSIVGVVPVSMI